MNEIKPLKFFIDRENQVDEPKVIPLEVFIEREEAKVAETTGTPIFNLPSKSELPEGAYGTTLELTPEQMKNFKSVRSELEKQRRQVEAMDKIQPGLLAEYDEYVASEGKVGFFSSIDRRATDYLGVVSGWLQAPSYGVGAAVEEAIKADINSPSDVGSAVWDGFQAFSEEQYAGYAPGAKVKSKETDISELFAKYGLLDVKPGKVKGGAANKEQQMYNDLMVDFEGDYARAREALHWTAGLTATIFIDPINLVPGAGLAAVPGKVYRAARHLPGGKATQEIFERMFKVHPELKDNYREELINLKRRYGAQAENEIVAMIDEVDAMVAHMSPRERRVLGTLMDKPNFMEQQVDALVNGGIILPERAKVVKDQAKIIQKFTKKLFDAEVNAPLDGVIDPTMFRDYYLHGMQAVDPRLIQQHKKAHEMVADTRRVESTRRGGGGPLPGMEAVLGASREKTWENQLDRAISSVRGDVDYSTELDIGNILKSRAAQSVRHVVSRKFAETVLTNPEIATKIDFDPSFFNARGRRVLESDFTWEDVKKTIETPLGKEGPAGPGQGMKVYEIKKKVKVGDDLETGPKYREEIIGAYRLPNEVFNFLSNSEKLMGSAKELTWYGKAFDDLTNVWKGWATLGTGYHARNMISIMNSNWMAGVGRDANGVFSMKDFMLRNLQALKIMAVANGAGRLPGVTKKAANVIAKRYGWDSLDDIPDLKIKDAEGNPLSYAQIAELGENYGVPQVASSLYNTDAGAANILWNSDLVDKKVPLKALQEVEGLDPRVAEVLSVEGRKGVADYLSDYVGQGNSLLKLNRGAAQIVENQGRWTLFLDSLAKGKPVEVAAEMPRMWHFDYRSLTDFEKQTFRRIIPFYAWQRFAAPRVMMAVLENPGQIAQMPKAKQALENLNPDFEEAEKPDYWDEVMAWQIPYMNEDNMPAAAQLDIPFIEINRLNIKDVMSSGNPIFTVPMQMYFNEDIFMGSGIERFSGEMADVYFPAEGEESVTDFPFLPEGMELPDELKTKKARWMMGKLIPPLGKAIRWQEAEAKGTGGLQLLSEFSGVKIRLLDERRLFRANTYKRRKYGRDFFEILKQRARTDAEFNKKFPHLAPLRRKITAPAGLFSPALPPSE